MNLEEIKKRCLSILDDKELVNNFNESNLQNYLEKIIEQNNTEINSEIEKMTFGKAKNEKEYFKLIKNENEEKIEMDVPSWKYVLLSLQNNLLNKEILALQNR